MEWESEAAGFVGVGELLQIETLEGGASVVNDQEKGEAITLPEASLTPLMVAV
jgi:hypothetical protein